MEPKRKKQPRATASSDELDDAEREREQPDTEEEALDEPPRTSGEPHEDKGLDR
ncbi:MAG TPA: hypothetical protein VHB21_26225 [Minicystis sp.]|nr:hypothetical protein [Minicystis sp.]